VTIGASALAAAVLLVACGTPATPYALDATFTTCGATGSAGPNQTACDAAYTGTDLEGEVSVAAGIQSFTVEQSGTYRITVEGAQGASAEPNFDGGRGARAQADLDLSAGDVLQIAVGQAGSGDDSETNGGGGGGSFVVGGSDVPLVIAGGGGGMRDDADQNGCDANTGTFGIVGSGSSSTSSCDAKGDAETLGGAISSPSYGSAGAGFFGDGADDVSGATTLGFGGSSWANGLVGGDWNDSCGGADPAEGGFGGGGSGSGCFGGGGGGGYSGGDGGWIAGGGGSFVTASATNTSVAVGAGIGLGDGVVTIEYRGD
jgi:hypothetical protein